jgi:hypothetical protein
MAGVILVAALLHALGTTAHGVVRISSTLHEQRCRRVGAVSCVFVLAASDSCVWKVIADGLLVGAINYVHFKSYHGNVSLLRQTPPPPSTPAPPEKEKEEEQQDEEQQEEQQQPEAAAVPQTFVFSPEGVVVDPKILALAQPMLHRAKGKAGGSKKAVIYSQVINLLPAPPCAACCAWRASS